MTSNTSRCPLLSSCPFLLPPCCTGTFLYYFGCSNNIRRRYKDDDGRLALSSQVHIVHATTDDPSFSFSFAPLAAAPPTTDDIADTKTALELEREIGSLIGITHETLGRLVLNAQLLGEALWSLYSQ